MTQPLPWEKNTTVPVPPAPEPVPLDVYVAPAAPEPELVPLDIYDAPAPAPAPAKPFVDIDSLNPAQREAVLTTEGPLLVLAGAGSGKTRVGEQIALLTGREHIDLDRTLEERLGMPCADFIVERGEAAFREQETAELADISKRSGLVLSTGGGVVTRDENYPLLHQNSQIVMLNRKLDELAHKGRPITARDGIDKLAEQRMPRYRAWADYIIDSRDCAAKTAAAIVETL